MLTRDRPHKGHARATMIQEAMSGQRTLSLPDPTGPVPRVYQDLLRGNLHTIIMYIGLLQQRSCGTSQLSCLCMLIIKTPAYLQF